jgi:hypothetical protein
MRRKRPLTICLTICLFAACDLLPGAPPDGDRWELVLLNKKSSVYGGSACVSQPTESYCKTWVDDPYAFNGTLRRTHEWTLNLGERGQFSATGEAGAVDTVIVDLLEPGTGCGSYQLFFRTHRDSIFGTFLHTSDCHAAGNSGTFVGRP